MIDKRSPLPGGTVLVGKTGVRYTVADGRIGRGGSALVYPALREGSGKLFVIKECYPLSDRYEFVRRDWAVCPKDGHEGGEYLNALRSGLSRESEIGQAIALIARQNRMTVEQLKPYVDESFNAAVIRSVLTSKVMRLIRDAAEVTEIN